MINAELVWSSAARGTLLECPVWCAQTQSLYWIDVVEPSVHGYGFGDGRARRWALPRPPGCIALTSRPGILLVAMRNGLAELELATGELTRLALSGDDLLDDRFNDGAVDPFGVFWIGSMDRKLKQPSGRLFRIEADLRSQAVPIAAVLANGLCFDADGRRAYLAKTFEREIHVLDIAQPGSRLAASRRWASLDGDPGRPDGATVSADGCLWSARVGGGRIDRYGADGRLLDCLRVHASHPTHCAFGGPELTTLFVTTSRYGPEFAAVPSHDGYDGRVLAYRLAHAGRLPARFGEAFPSHA